MNPVAVSAANVEQSVLDAEFKTAVEKTKDELVQKDINAALTKAGINPAHVDSEDHIESNQSKGWITAEQAEQAREIIKTVGEAKRANLNMQMIENIAKGRVQKFLKENTLEEQGYQMGDGKTAVKEVIKAADAEAKVLVFKRVSLAD
jgi:elongation factor Ts